MFHFKGESLVKRVFLLVALSAILLTSAAAQSGQSPQPAPAAPDRAEARRQAFDIVWRTVKEKHYDPTFGGVDWDKVREQYAPRVAAVKSDDELYQLLQQMLGELGQSHFNIIPPEAVPSADARESEEGQTGIDLRIIDSQAVITRVEPGSKAAAAGLRPGFVIKQVDKGAVSQVIERISKSKLAPSSQKLYMTYAVLSRMSGRPGTTVAISYLDERDQLREAVIEREALKGEMSPAFGNFPPQHTEFEARRLAGGVGYIRFNIFVMSLLDRIKSAIREMKDAPGIIIDLRGNPGGVGAMAMGIAGVLETKQTSLGVMKMRTGHVNFAVYPQANPYTRPVVILVDELSASTSEIFAAGMQEIGRAVVVGRTSAGAALPSVIAKLPTGALFQYAFADFKSPKGVLIEGRGVAPDVEVKLTRAALAGGRDPQLEAAIEKITKK
jgi:carboxyl-terminal processing protease